MRPNLNCFCIHSRYRVIMLCYLQCCPYLSPLVPWCAGMASAQIVRSEGSTRSSVTCSSAAQAQSYSDESNASAKCAAHLPACNRDLHATEISISVVNDPCSLSKR